MKSHLEYFFYESMFSPRVRQTKRNNIENAVYEDVAQILNDDEKLKQYLPLRSEAIIELLRVLSGPGADIGDIETVISREPVVAVKVIATANSPLYTNTSTTNVNPLLPVDNLRDAITRVGISGINNLANNYLLQESMTVNLENYQMFGKTIWQHSLHVAFICHDLAGRNDHENPALCYLMGLVHDIGKIVIFNVLSNAYSERSADYLPCSKLFIELMTNKSALITERIIENWHFHQVIVDAVKRQKHQKKTGMAQMLYVANLLSESYIMIKNGCFEGQDGIDFLVKNHDLDQQYVDEFFNVADTIGDVCNA
ncbi:MAG: HD-like signal output (HDOD) protein [Phenylobacterium sp.]|jgi:HD-like signal output (HDOD) protein